MPSYTIRYPHPVSRVTWYQVEEGIRINIVATTEEMSPPKSPDLKAAEGDLVDMELEQCHRTPSAISLVVHHSGLDLYGQSSTVSMTGEMILPECSPPSACENTSTNSITILTPSHTSTTVFDSRRAQPRCVHTAGEEGTSRQECECLRMDRLETLQDVLAEERKHRPTFEERLKTPIVPIPRNVLTDTAIASFDVAFPEFQAEAICPQSDRKFDVSWELD